ncbi:MAG: phage capsid protein [Hyphomicrobiales bacterium]|nr:phage capsid protein [Hyphomicrobiales bacterium]
MEPFEIPAHFHRSYTSNVEMLLRRMGPVLLPYVSMGAYSGEAAQVVKQFGDVEFSEKTTRHSDTQFDELIHKQRWVFPTDYVLAIPVDKEDELKMLDSPLSPYAEAGRLAYGKKIDDIIIPSFFASAQTGKNGATPTVYDTNNTVEVNLPTGADRGLTIEKLRKARRLMLQKHIDLKAEQPYIGVTAVQLDDLLANTTVTSADYNSVKALVNGEIDTFLGFKFVHNEGFEVDANADRKCPVWVKSGIHFAQWNGLVTRIGDRADKNYLTQIHMSFSGAATRVNEDKVFQILCAE